MIHPYELNGAFHVKADSKYPWPCKPEPNRTINIYTDDVLTRGEDGWTKHTGLCCVGIQIPETDVVPFGKTVGIVDWQA